MKFGRGQIECEFQGWLTRAGAYESDASQVGDSTESRSSGRTHYIVEGPFETSYTLAVVNRNLAIALCRREGCAAYIAPAEGVEDYSVDAIAASKLPLVVQGLVQP